jgi:putative phosphoribosyl transferase
MSTRDIHERQVQVPFGRDLVLEGTLSRAVKSSGVVLFAHGSGSSRFSPRNRYVASALQRSGLATLLIDLLTAEEEEAERRTRHLRFDIGLLAERLDGAMRWLSQQAGTRDLPLGLFGSSTGAAAALVAAARSPEAVAAVVSRGGRPDLAGEALPLVRAPTLLIVGGHDFGVIELNEEALSALRAEKRLDIIPGATHLFEEPGALEKVAMLASDWFERHLAVRRARWGDEVPTGR